MDSSFRTVKLLPFVDGYDYFALGTGLVFIAFVIYYIIEEILVKVLLVDYNVCCFAKPLAVVNRIKNFIELI